MTPYYQDDAVTIYHGDCRELLPALAADLVLTDPPYGYRDGVRIGYESEKRRGSTPGATRGSGGHYGRDWGKIVGDDEPFDPSHLLAFPRLILWGAHWYASKLPDSPGWLVWDKKRGGTVSAAFRGIAGTAPHGALRYRRGCRCLTCRRDEALRVRAAYERSCDLCNGPTWGTRCKECIRREAPRSVQPRGLHYQWGCP